MIMQFRFVCMLHNPFAFLIETLEPLKTNAASEPKAEVHYCDYTLTFDLSLTVRRRLFHPSLFFKFSASPL